MFRVKKKRPEKSVTKFLPDLPEIQFISLILLMRVMCFARSLQDQSLVYLQYALILLPLIHMHTRRHNEDMKTWKTKGGLMISYLFCKIVAGSVSCLSSICFDFVALDSHAYAEA